MIFPDIDPVAFFLFGWPVRWYGISYLIGIGMVGLYCRWALKFFPTLSKNLMEDVIFWSVLGLLIGGRLGYVFLYAPAYYAQNPLRILQVWEGGMAFHGGLLGVVIAASWYGLAHKKSLRQIADCLACGVPLALFWGRIGNFINQEHWGRPCDLPWCLIFPKVDTLSRHPSQLYEAFSEGILLFLLLHLALTRLEMSRRPGFLCGLFLIGYGTVRWVCEGFRTPDALYTVAGWELTAGQMFSLPMILAGLVLWLTLPRRYVPFAS